MAQRRRTSSPARDRVIKSEAPTAAVHPPENAMTSKVVYEFGGPLGSIGVMVGLPLVVLVLFFGCGREFCVADFQTAAELPWRMRDALSHTSLWSWKATSVVFGWCVCVFDHTRVRSSARLSVRLLA